MSEKGKLKIWKTKKGEFAGEIQLGNKKMPLPSFYELKDDRLNNSECEVEREKGQIKKVSLNGKELPKKKGKEPVTPAGKTETGLQEKSKAPSKDSFKVFLPRDTREAIQKLSPETVNFGLLLNKMGKYIQQGTEKEGFVLPGTNDFPFKVKFTGIDFEKLTKRRESAIKETGLLLETEKVEGKIQWRLVVGLGGESIYETALTLHPVYGFPYVPGSAVKGAVRSAVIKEFFAGDEKVALKDEGFFLVFGKDDDGAVSASQGLVYFFDAYPACPPKVVVDVLNPHYAPYYQDTSGIFPPGDYYNPVPVFFLTVEDTPLVFFLGVRKEKNKIIGQGRFKGEKLLETAVFWLKKTLAEYGLGAKTSAGYGLFLID